MNSPVTLAWICLVFLVSGIAGLGYQTTWSRMFTIGLGHETPAVLGVVAAFFGGLAMGAWVLDGWIRRAARPGRCVATIEFVIGGWAWITGFLIPALNEWGPLWTGASPSFALHAAVAFGLPFVTLLPATMAMGATLPAVERFAAPLAGDRRVLGAVYAANTLGAVMGVLVSTFVLTPAWGYRGTVLVLGAVNIGCGLAFLRLDRPGPSVAAGAGPASAVGVGRSRLYLTLFLTGLLGIGYEVVGLRLLSRVLENTVYTFAVTLAVFLAGTAAGAACYQRFCRNRLSADRSGWLFMGLAVATLGGAWGMKASTALYQALRGALGDGLGGVVLAEGLVAALVFGIPALLMGMLFSLLVQSVAANGAPVGRAVSVNLVGSAFAAPVFGFWLLPTMGARWTWLTIGLGYLLLLPRARRLQWAALAVPVLIAVTVPSRFPSPEVPAGGREIAFREGRLDAVSVIEFFDGNRSLWVNQRFGMGGTGSWIAERRQGQIPLLLHPDPRRALFLGLGTGITFAAAAAHPGLMGEGVELIPEIVALHGHFAPWNELPADGRLRVLVADARRYVRAAPDRFDVIVADLFHPARDGAGLLYTREHFVAVRERLADGGIFCQWLPLYQLDVARLRLIVRTFLEVFPEASGWLLRLNIDTPVLGLVGGDERRGYPADWMERRVRSEALLEDLKRIGLGDSWQLLGGFLGGSEALRQFAGSSGRLNTDDRPLVTFETPRHGVRRTGVSYETLLEVVEEFRSDPADVLESGAGREELAGYFRARETYLRGLVAEGEGRMAEALDRYVESARLSAVFTTGYARCLTLAMQQAGRDRPAAMRLLERLVEARPERPVARDLLKRMVEER